ncbi:heat shock cognate 71 kDa protein-like [Dysidea avara]|uniref:heat shock cognate 71 kDa protein-like n=1 Tax=Dysidea avara TaxID=196820 RepID=UPI003320DD50
MNAPVIGIDLGTSYSCVGVYRNSKVEIIANDQGNKITPSYVAFNDTERLIGDSAKNQVSMNPYNTIFGTNRLIGHQWNDAKVQYNRKYWPSEVVNEGGKPKIQVKYQGRSLRLCAEEVASMVLFKIKETAEVFLGRTVHNAVITVPAYFNSSQRQATKDAATIAGLNVLRIVTGPTAAAIAYGLNIGKEERNVLVFDLGGGTFDVSVLNIADGVFHVKATNGDTQLGGEDFDNRMVSFFIKQFKQQYKKDVGHNKRALCRLRKACEKAKCMLSTQAQASIAIDSFYEGIDFNTIITRSQFESLNIDLFKSTIRFVETCLCAAKLRKSQINDVILVGGSTRIPKIQKLLQEYFGGKELNKSINPDEAVAYGAAVQGAILGKNKHEIGRILLVDVAPMSLGIATACGIMDPFIKRNTTIPINQMKTVTTYHDQQCTMLIEIYEGEHALIKHNKILGCFELTGIPPAPKGVPQIDVQFDVSTNGILSVAAKIRNTGGSKEVIVTSKRGNLSALELQRMKLEAKKYKEEDDKQRELTASKNTCESYAFNMKGILEEALSKCKLVVDWIDENPTAEKEEYDAHKVDLESLCKSTIKELQDAANSS